MLTFDNLGEASELERGTRSAPAPGDGHPSVAIALPRLLDELDRHRLRATFFVEAINCELNPDAVREIAARGHELGVHGWRHEQWGDLNLEEERRLLGRARRAFGQLDLEPRGFRPPGGELTAHTPALLRELGFEWCSPAGGDLSLRDGLRYVPFDWELVDAYHLMERFAGVRRRLGDQPAPLGPPEAAGRLRSALARGRPVETLILHPFLMLSEGWWRAVRELLWELGDLDDAWVGPGGELSGATGRQGIAVHGTACAENPHLAVPPVPAGAPLPDARAACVLVCGRDQDEQVMLDTVARLDLDDVAYLIARAAGLSWYPGRYFDPLARNQPHVDWSLEAIERILRSVAAAGVPAERTVLAGFSQGACVVAELLARRFPPLGAAAVLTGTLLGEPHERATPGRLDGLPVLVVCGRDDDWIELADARATSDAFRQAGAEVSFEIDDDPEHRISDLAVAGLRKLLTAL